MQAIVAALRCGPGRRRAMTGLSGLPVTPTPTGPSATGAIVNSPTHGIDSIDANTISINSAMGAIGAIGPYLEVQEARHHKLPRVGACHGAALPRRQQPQAPHIHRQCAIRPAQELLRSSRGREGKGCG